MEILTGRERRRVWSDEQKLEILRDVSTGVATVADIARQHDLIPQQIYTWRRQFTKKAEAAIAQSPGFLPVAIVPERRDEETADKERPEKPASVKSVKVEIRCKGGRVLKVDAGLEAAVLQALIRSVEGA